ncbi:receptor like protein kinase S.2 [Dioscorea cayenensis subsp. rotundata]|uniref:Receptor like protein kinase S.2 n=1 Tax=Dioscorea cayennensis subsp. rotundata TaxID=55577 RepID=A0AB40BEW0_DIOCR|nr:receptor like protein kinase S.2 [Dioscorea cayenensis subsp. rotundata]
MPLNRLCFILPADTDEISPEPAEVSPAPTNKPKPKRTAKSLLHLPAASVSVSTAVMNTTHLALFLHSKTSPASTQATTTNNNKKKVTDSNPRIFSYSELYIGSNGFSDKEILGSGGFGRVYRAVLPSDNTVVAVKCVAGNRADRLEKTFAAELAAVAQLRHRNLVRLRGWCVHDEQLLLVYDYMPNRSLDRVLFTPVCSPSPAPVLSWERRKRIVAGLAAALFYLHEQLDTQIIHRDVKTSNVMLDSGYNARLGDFGLARWLEHDELGLSTRSISLNNNYQFRMSETSRIGGTIGYLPPESFQKRGMATAKSDVFSFGVVVLEVATGRRAVDLAFPDEQIFMLDWVRRLADDNKTLNAADPKLRDGSYTLIGMRRFIHLGLLCSLHNPTSRPTMKWVVDVLAGDCSGELPALPSFQSHPQYISLSSSSSDTTTSTATITATLSSFVTAANTTMFLTADNGTGNGNGTGEEKSIRDVTSFPNVDTPREIPFKEILTITDNFSESHMVAELDFGTGYHGYLHGRYHVLVKRLGMRTCPALRARFSDELHNLGKLRHRNLVQLRGWCTEQGEMLVVYDYSSNASLSNLLFLPKSSVLSWQHRHHIVKNLASAILYLHEEWDEQVIHRNITSSAIFLDPDMNPRLGSFALAEFLSRNEHGHHASSSPVRGIFGYMSPEYIETGEATTMADVYSFGVVVLEVVTGMMAVDFRRPEVLLVRKVRNFEASNGTVEELVDWRLDGKCDHGELMRMVKLGIVCTRSDPDSRPSMKQIVSILDGKHDDLLTMFEGKKTEGREEWERKNASSLSSIRSIQALGIQ